MREAMLRAVSLLVLAFALMMLGLGVTMGLVNTSLGGTPCGSAFSSNDDLVFDADTREACETQRSQNLPLALGFVVAGCVGLVTSALVGVNASPVEKAVSPPPVSQA